MHSAIPPNHDDDDGCAAGNLADSSGLWRGCGCAPASGACSRWWLAGVAVSDAVYHACNLPLPGGAAAALAAAGGGTNPRQLGMGTLGDKLWALPLKSLRTTSAPGAF